MLDRRRSTLLDRIGRRLARLPAATRFGIALAGLILFIGLSATVWVAASQLIAPQLGARLNAPATSITSAKPGTPETFSQRLERVTEIAKAVFLDLGLSRDHFITKLSDERQFGSRTFDFIYWEIWVPRDFDVERVLFRMRAQKGVQEENARLEQETIDEKTRVVRVFLDGINTHQFLFTKADQEAPEGARILLANVPADVTKIDVGAIPEVKYTGAPRLAIVIDDIGIRDTKKVQELFFELPVKVTFSVMPYGPTSVEMAEEAHRRGHEVMLHLPMEPLDMQNHDPGSGKLILTMNDAEVRRTVLQDLARVPHVAGANNHMGSAFTRDAGKMQAALAPIKEQGHFFLDSMTIGNSVAFQTAKKIGLRSAARNLFLDIQPDREAVRRQVELAGRIARAQGKAIAIGHPFQYTFQALQEELPKLLAQGIEVVPVAQLVE